MSAVQPYWPTQDQYVFIYDAVLESLTCEDAQIPASGLSNVTEKLKEKDRETEKTVLETQFHVCHTHQCTQSVCDKCLGVWHLLCI